MLLHLLHGQAWLARCRIGPRAGALMCFSLVLSGCADREMPFDSQMWKDAEGNSWDVERHKMVGDLLKKHVVIGMQEAEVDELLGVSTTKNKLTEYSRVYRIGVADHFVDHKWLAIRFDEGRVVEVTVTED